MLFKKLAVLTATVLLFAGFAMQPALAGHKGDKPCPMKAEMSCCKGMQGKCPMKHVRAKASERTAGSVPVYGVKGGCCKGKKPAKCPMKHDKMAGMSHENHGNAHAGHMMADKSYGGAEADALDAVMAKMHRDMAVPYTGDADADFIRGMIPHHQGAIDMARVVLEHGNDPDAQGLARNIIRAQKGEIAWMQRWLKQRQIPATGPINLNQ